MRHCPVHEMPPWSPPRHTLHSLPHLPWTLLRVPHGLVVFTEQETSRPEKPADGVPLSGSHRRNGDRCVLLPEPSLETEPPGPSASTD